MGPSDHLRRDTVFGFLPFSLGLQLLAAIVFIPLALRGYADFRQLYAGAYMVRNGLGHSLYDSDVQYRIQNAVVSPAVEVLPVNHPAYEYLLLAPITLLSYRKAYVIWSAVNGTMLYLSARRLHFYDPWLLIALLIGFAPVFITLVQGQDSVLLLALLVLAVEKEYGFNAGLILGFSAFRFHVLLPILLISAVWKRWQFICGALSSAGFLAMISIVIVGISQSRAYVTSLVSTAAVRRGSTANLYGAIELLTRDHRNASIAIWAGFVVLNLWHIAFKKPSLRLAIATVPILSYHLLTHDLIILLIPIACTARWRSAGTAQFVAGISGLFPPWSFIAALPTTFFLFNLASEDTPQLDRLSGTCLTTSGK